jgi:hypothetical protein
VVGSRWRWRRRWGRRRTWHHQQRQQASNRETVPANCPIFSLVQLSTAPGNFLIASFTPSSSGLNSSSPSFSINLLIVSNSQTAYRGGWYDQVEGCVSSFLSWLYWSLMNDVRGYLCAFSSWVTRGMWMEVSSRGFRRSQTAVVGTQWKGGEKGWG